MTPGGRPASSRSRITKCRERRGGRRLPHHRIAHERRRGGEIGADRGEVERRDRVDESLERPVLHPVPHPRRGDRLLGVDPLGEMGVEPEEVDHLAGGVDVRLEDRLALAEHRGAAFTVWRHGPASRSAALRRTAARSSKGRARQAGAALAAAIASTASALVAPFMVPSTCRWAWGCRTAIRDPRPICCRPPIVIGRSIRSDWSSARPHLEPAALGAARRVVQNRLVDRGFGTVLRASIPAAFHKNCRRLSRSVARRPSRGVVERRNTVQPEGDRRRDEGQQGEGRIAGQPQREPQPTAAHRLGVDIVAYSRGRMRRHVRCQKAV